jgi:hypothetical protein
MPCILHPSLALAASGVFLIAILTPFATLFQRRTWVKAQVLLLGTVLTPGRRTVTSALRVTGLSDDRTFANYHHVLNCAQWSPLKLSQVLLRLLLHYFEQKAGPLVFGIETPWNTVGGRELAPGAFTGMA